MDGAYYYGFRRLISLKMNLEIHSMQLKLFVMWIVVLYYYIVLSDKIVYRV